MITDNVPPGALALGRSRQVVKPDWAARKVKPAAKEPTRTAKKTAKDAASGKRPVKKKPKTKR